MRVVAITMQKPLNQRLLLSRCFLTSTLLFFLKDFLHFNEYFLNHAMPVKSFTPRWIEMIGECVGFAKVEFSSHVNKLFS